MSLSFDQLNAQPAARVNRKETYLHVQPRRYPEHRLCPVKDQKPPYYVRVETVDGTRWAYLVDANGKRATAGVPSTSYIDMLLAEVMALRANLRLVEAQAKVKILEEK